MKEKESAQAVKKMENANFEIFFILSRLFMQKTAKERKEKRERNTKLAYLNRWKPRKAGAELGIGSAQIVSFFTFPTHKRKENPGSLPSRHLRKKEQWKKARATLKMSLT